MKKASTAKIITAKQARKRSEKSFKILSTQREVGNMLHKYTELGFTNITIDIKNDIVVPLTILLTKKGYKIFTRYDGFFTTIDIEW